MLKMENDTLVVTGALGTEWELDSIQAISLEDELPPIKICTGGLSTGNIKKGQFNLEQLGTGRLYVNTNVTPYLFILKEDDYIIINAKDPDVTREWFRLLEEEISNKKE